MLLRCPSCNSAFQVSDQAIGAGRTVKCSKCGHKWFQAGAEGATGAPSISDAPQMAYSDAAGKLPVASRYLDAKKWMIGSFLGVLILSVLIMVINFRQPMGLSSLFAPLGFTQTRDVVLQELSIERAREENHLNFMIKGQLVNLSEEKRDIPVIRVQAISEGGSVMKDMTIPIAESQLEPLGKIPLDFTLTGISGATKSLVLDLGSPVELTLR